MPARRELTMRQLRQLLRLARDGVSAREIGRTLGVARSTVQDNLKRANAAGLAWPVGAEITDAVLYVPLSPTGAELLFEVFSQRYERGSTIVTSNLPFEYWTAAHRRAVGPPHPPRQHPDHER